MTRRGRLAFMVVATLAVAGCRPRQVTPDPKVGDSVAPPAAPSQPRATTPAISTPVTFVDVTAASGVAFRHVNGAFGAKYLPETMGSGVAVFDFDGDGLQDLFFVQFAPWPGAGRPAAPMLCRNLGGLRFEDVSSAAGFQRMAGMGVAVGDMDGDRDEDVFVACLGPDHLLRNDGGRFVDVTAAAGIADDDFGSSATWVDVDNDRDLDLFVANYVQWSVDGDIRCTLDGVNKSYCTPESYQGASPRLWRNEGGGRFVDGTKEAGLLDPTFKALGVVAADLDGDGWQDLLVANDTQPNALFRGQGGGRFVDEGVRRGVAYDENGVARAGMGIDVADVDGSGRPAIVVGNFANEMIGLYRDAGHGVYVDAAPSSTVGAATLLTLAFACVFADVDLDGDEDLLVVDGHLDEDVERVQPQVKYRQPPHLFANRGDGNFDEVTALVGPDFARPVVGRGAATGDLDGDGDLDLVLTENGGPARVLRNDLVPGTHWLRVDADPGCVVRVSAGGRTLSRAVKGASGYLSQSQRAVTFGLGDATKVDRVEVSWPGGATTTLDVAGVDRLLRAERP